MRMSVACLLAIGAATVGLPLVGAGLLGRNLRALRQLPSSLTVPEQYPHFSWFMTVLVLTPFAALAATWLRSRHPPIRSYRSPSCEAAPVTSLPTWGWFAVTWTGFWWLVAWTRFDLFEPLQRHTFFPLWLGFILGVNAVTCRKSGTCLMIRAPARWIGLFVTSGVFWWIFEWLNRFTRNWHYLGISDFGPIAYATNATLCFSTVLPAVVAVTELLETSRRWLVLWKHGPQFLWIQSKTTASVLTAIGVLGLVAAGAFPTLFYPTLWVAPLALLLGNDICSPTGTLSRMIAAGDWRVAATWSTAALICGLFWELWNAQSEAKWIYTVPYVDGWHVFEMPILGYLGYLPFGLQCYFVAVGVLGERAPFSKASST